MIRTASLLAMSAALLGAATAGSFACVSGGNPVLTPGEDAALPFEDAGFSEDGGFPEDGPLTIKDGAVTLKDGAVVLVPTDAPAPDYATDLSSLVLKNNASSKVSSLSGTVDLDFHTVSGNAYLTFHGTNLAGSTFAQLDALWTANGSSAVPIAAAGTVAIPASSLVSIGDTLPETSSVIVMLRTSGVATYQALVITFDPQ